MKYITESERTIPLLGNYDVIVCGGGPAGVSAAIAAGRQGARTLLIELTGCLGGIWTAGLLSYVLDNGGKGGLLAEIRDRLCSMDGYLHMPHPAGPQSFYDGQEDFSYDAEAMKLLLEQMCVQAGVELLLHTRIVGAQVGGGKLRTIAVEGYGGRAAYSGAIFIDCTGNGDLAAQAGCRFELGHPQSGKTQPATMMVVVSGVPQTQRETLTTSAKKVFLQLLTEAGAAPSYKNPTLFRLPHPDLCALMLNHQYSVPCDAAAEITAATVAGRNEVHQVVRALSRMPGWEQLKIVATPAHIGLREGRRIVGHVQVTIDDLMAGKMVDDPVCLVKLPIDVHALEPDEEHISLNRGLATKPYHIPYLSLIAKDVDNLALAGRCISGDFYAHASYRVTGNSVPLGEAAGIAAAMAAADNCPLAALDGKRVTAQLRRNGYTL